jgi:hypothetical protein
LEYAQAENGIGGWLHVSYKAQGNRVQRLTRQPDGFQTGPPRVPEMF